MVRNKGVVVMFLVETQAENKAHSPDAASERPTGLHPRRAHSLACIAPIQPWHKIAHESSDMDGPRVIFFFLAWWCCSLCKVGYHGNKRTT